MAVSQTDIDALNTAIASGERQVSIGGQSITYQTVESLIKARNDMRAELAMQSPSNARSKRTLLVYGGRGY